MPPDHIILPMRNNDLVRISVCLDGIIGVDVNIGLDHHWWLAAPQRERHRVLMALATTLERFIEEWGGPTTAPTLGKLLQARD
jgi:hypothetical protein